jgi:glycosyltransferase involved in cell wall biosynthesis
MSKKKITIVIDASRNKSGGAINYLKNFIKYLNFKKKNIKIILFSHQYILDQISNKSFLIKKNHPFLEKNIFFQIIWQLIFLPIYLKKNRINILYSTDSSTFCNYSNSIVFNQDILSFDKEAVNQIPLSLEKIRLYIIKFLQIRSMNKAKEVIFLSKYSKKIISKYLNKNKNYNIIPHGIDENLKKLGKFNKSTSSKSYELKNIIRLVYVSPLFLYKNHITVAKSFLSLKKKYKNLDIKFIGDYKKNLDIYNKLLSLSPIINKNNFTGDLTHKDVIKNLVNSDVFIFASSSETFGISLLEAMVIGMPIICSNKSSLPEILQNGGLYFNPKNDLELANKIEKLIQNKNLRKKISLRAREIANNYSWDKNIKQFNKIINKLI